MNAFKVSHPSEMCSSQRPMALVSDYLAYISDLTITWQSDELGFDTAEWEKKKEKKGRQEF